MDFDSHISGVVISTVALVNALTPGWARGRQYPGPAPAELTEQVRAALAAGSSPPGRRPSETEATEFVSYAARLRDVFEHRTAGDMDAACEQVNALLRETGAVPVLSNHDGGPWHLHFHALDAEYPQSWVAPMATSLAVVLGDRHADRLGVCSAQACDRVYVDTSRNGTRRFCSTACQSRVKTAQFRQRQTMSDG